MMTLRRALFLALVDVALGLTACCSSPDPASPPASPEDRAVTCATVCSHAAALGCPAAKPTPGGASCATVCSNVQASGVVRWNLGCRARAKTCSAMDACETP